VRAAVTLVRASFIFALFSRVSGGQAYGGVEQVARVAAGAAMVGYDDRRWAGDPSRPHADQRHPAGRPPLDPILALAPVHQNPDRIAAVGK
jgi:hypothetical protein